MNAESPTLRSFGMTLARLGLASLLLAALLLAGCTTPGQVVMVVATPTPTTVVIVVTPVPPTETATPVPPTATPTFTPVPPTPTSTPTSTPEASETPERSGAEQILDAAYEAGEAATTFHFDMQAEETVKMQGQSMQIDLELVGDFQAPDRLQASMEMSVLGQTVAVDMIQIGDSSWVTDPATGEWQVSTEAVSNLQPQEFAGLRAEDFQDLELVGEEQVSGRQTYHLSGTASLPLDLMQGFEVTDATMQVDYWIDKETSNLLKAVVEGTAYVTYAGTDATVDLSMTMLLSDYGEPVTIEPPM